jgi:hypothetical protein
MATNFRKEYRNLKNAISLNPPLSLVEIYTYLWDMSIYNLRAGHFDLLGMQKIQGGGRRRDCFVAELAMTILAGPLCKFQWSAGRPEG